MANHKKFVKFYHAYSTQMETIYLKNILDQEGNINNYVIPYDDCLYGYNFYTKGSTVLHLLGSDCVSISIFKILLKRGANFTIKDDMKSTVLHLLFNRTLQAHTNVWISAILKNKSISDPIVDLILTTHVTSQNFTNPCDNNGISHFHIACMTNNYKTVEFFLRNGISVAHAINKDSKLFAGYTPLHLAVECCAYDTIDILLKYGANVNIKNTDGGLTPLRMLLLQRMKLLDVIDLPFDSSKIRKNVFRNMESHEKLINVILEKIVYDDSCLSHFHVICTTKNLIKITYASIHIIDINHCINKTSPIYPGYTALHFAARHDINAVKILLDKGANIEIRDAEGMTPLDICLLRYRVEDIHYILSNHAIWKNIIMSNARTKLIDILFAMQSVNTLVEFLTTNHCDVNVFIPTNSSLWPGCALLHLAVTFLRTNEQHELVLIGKLLSLGASVVHQDARDQTPIHLAFRLGHVPAVDMLLEFHRDTRNPVNQVHLSHLHIACAAQNELVVEKLLTNGIDVNSSVLSTFKWYHKSVDNSKNPIIFFINAGSTPLHICVANRNCTIAKLLLRHGGDLCAKDDNGLTPIHRILTLDCDYTNISDVLLFSSSFVECIEEKSKLSHLHVASFVGHISAVERLFELGVDVNITISHEKESGVSELPDNYSYGHPSYEPLLFLNRYSNVTPFQFSLQRRNFDVSKLLIQKGVDVHLRNRCRSTPFYTALKHQRDVDIIDFLSTILQKDEHLRKYFEKDTGLTLLHVACCRVDVELVRNSLHKGADVNASIQCHSPVWPGYTPLHVLMISSENIIDIFNIDRCQTNIDIMLSLLLENGADVTISNAEDDTPLHLDKLHVKFTAYANVSRLKLMLNSQKNVAINPINRYGISHFHIACYLNEIEIITEFLKNGVDINQAINEFFDRAPSYTALHLIMLNGTTNFETLKILLHYGADINARDALDTTPLSLVFQPFQRSSYLQHLFFQTFLDHGADMTIHNINGMTPLMQLIIADVTIKDIDLILQHGCQVNQFNSVTEEGFLAMVFKKHFSRHPEICQAMINAPNILEVDFMNRTIIHNIVSTHVTLFNDLLDATFKGTINRFIKQRVGVDHQDKLGRTALHLAAKFQNDKAASALLDAGADINITDLNGKSAYANIFELHPDCSQREYRENNYYVFLHHVKKLIFCGLHVSAHNRRNHRRALQKSRIYPIWNDILCEELNKIKETSIGYDSLTLHDFMSETGAVATYNHMTFPKRQAINEFFRSIDTKHFPRLIGLLRLQYKKALLRAELVETAKAALNKLLDFSLPDLCSESLFRYLANADLENIIAATN